MVMRCIVLFVAVALPAQAAEPNVLPGTERLQWPEADLSPRLMDGAHRFVEREIEAAAAERGRFWPEATASVEQWRAAVEPNRQELRRIIGAVDRRLEPRMEQAGDLLDVAAVDTGTGYEVLEVRWPVLVGVFGEGLLLQPQARPVAGVVLIPDADQTPEMLLGMGGEGSPAARVARHLAAQGVAVVIPTLISRDKLGWDDPQLRRSDQTNREWLYRQAFHMGRHVIGYEVQKVLAAVDWLEARFPLATPDDPRDPDDDPPAQPPGGAPGANPKIGVLGYAEGGLIALYASALDSRIDVTLVSGYFDSREEVWQEPIYRNVWSLLRRFGDAEIASLIQPRQLIVEHSTVPQVAGHKGDWRTPHAPRVAAEVSRIRVPRGGRQPIHVQRDDAQAVSPFSARAVNACLAGLGIEPLAESPREDTEALGDHRRFFSADARQQRAVRQIEQHVQGLVRGAEHVRDRFFLYAIMPQLAGARWSTQVEHPVHDWRPFAEAARPYRERFRAEAIGQFDEPLLPPRPRTRQIRETEHWTAWDVVLDVYPDLFAWGVLLVPKDIQPGERRPVVVCQHGRDGVPRDTIDNDRTAYNNFAAQLAERGFITFSPHNLYRFEDRYRWLDRKANNVGCTLFSFILAQHDQILRWLDSLPWVDGERIAFYGLSYGGETAVRVPPILEKYCLSICSGDFNQWTRKVAATDQPFSFMRTIEWEMPYWNLGQTFDYAEMAALMIPRPFMVERGHLDLVGRDQWVAHEYGKVRWLYAQLGLAERTGITFFQGGHSIRGQATFDFLHHHLNWPKADRPNP